MSKPKNPVPAAHYRVFRELRLQHPFDDISAPLGQRLRISVAEAQGVISTIENALPPGNSSTACSLTLLKAIGAIHGRVFSLMCDFIQDYLTVHTEVYGVLGIKGTDNFFRMSSAIDLYALGSAHSKTGKAIPAEDIKVPGLSGITFTAARMMFVDLGIAFIDEPKPVKRVPRRDMTKLFRGAAIILDAAGKNPQEIARLLKDEAGDVLRELFKSAKIGQIEAKPVSVPERVEVANLMNAFGFDRNVAMRVLRAPSTGSGSALG